jgi:hypothetical protein
LDEEKFGGYYFGEDYFLSTYRNDSIIQDICSKKKYTIDSLIILRYGSFKKYSELLQKDDEQTAIYLETPNTVEAAYGVLRNDYNQYIWCYPNDTITAITMLIDEVTKFAQLDSLQSNLLRRRAINALHTNIKERNYNDAMFMCANTRGHHDISIGKSIKEYLNFYHIIENVLTKSQFDTYLKYHEKMEKIRYNVSTQIFGIIGQFPERLTSFDAYTKRENRKKYKDEQDFLRKEVFKKPE